MCFEEPPVPPTPSLDEMVEMIDKATELETRLIKEDAEARAQKGLKHKVIQVIDEKEKCTEGSNSNRNAYVVHAK